MSGLFVQSRFRIWIPGNGETEDNTEGRTIEALDEQAAAEAYAERSDRDSGDYSIAHDGGAEIAVRRVETLGKPDRGETMTFRIDVETRPTYSASLVKPKPK